MSIIQFHDSITKEYDVLKKEAISVENIVTEIPLSDFDLDLKQIIRVKGVIVPTSEESYNFFLKNVLKIDPKAVTAFKNATDEKSELAMLKLMKAGLAKKTNETVRVVVNKHTHKIVSFLGKNDKFLSNESLINLFELVMNRNKNLELKDFYLDKQTGELTLNARASKQVDLGKDEMFLGGLTFKNDIKTGTTISEHTLRLICTNGMTGFQNIPFSFKDTQGGINSLMEKIDLLASTNFISAKFTADKEEKENTIASLSEMNFAKKILMNNSTLTREQLDYYLPFKETYEFLKRKGVSAEHLNSSQLKNCPTILNYWDLINIMTDFGSHDYGHNANYSKIQAGAGHLLKKKPDSEGFVIFSN